MNSSAAENTINNQPIKAQEEHPFKEFSNYLGMTGTHTEYASQSSSLKPKLPGPTFHMKVVSEPEQTSVSQANANSPICMESYKREWYKGYIKTKAYEQSDPFGFSSANASQDPSRAPSPMPRSAPGKYQMACVAALRNEIYGKADGVNTKVV
ncbi:hypothetical protein AOQ84DRAFT_227537 [Glonium stellatum]|uniref:Uncharacterized protein n=1 Tax=Glonium stellatum TaxID=574774 RepID=A0A8E2F8J3_9PEZI|nr:hypothetical protein AOQ84DRAFT_227537 [Glonium stellatum]